MSVACLLVLFVLSLVGAQTTQDPSKLNCNDRMDFSCSQSNFSIGECNVTTGTCSCNQSNFSIGECNVTGTCQSTLGDCFTVSDDNYCVESSICYSYQPEGRTCRFGRRRQLVAILLSAFLINFGAANFYIERYDLAVPQIVLGLILCLFQFGSCAVAGTRDGETTPPCIICCSINTVLSLLFLSWWVADLVTFATNRRSDGHLCPLY